ncbi:MAG TPA: penicillin-binding transpeptidase domain-containing protein, partial [Coxiellaceae bacterium]|nr:penicillin-binding transpeptidase domain-containing protein [Coxiellaceae bacterium]
LAQAYSVFANQGVEYPATFIKLEKPPEGKQVISPQVADEVLHMLQAVVANGGTGTRARVPGYTVAGKTGTAYIAGPKGYDIHHKYIGSFVGITPVTNPRLVIAVVIVEPQGQHLGAIVAAPAFAKVAGNALRLLNVKPDDLEHAQDKVAVPFTE